MEVRAKQAGCWTSGGREGGEHQGKQVHPPLSPAHVSWGLTPPSDGTGRDPVLDDSDRDQVPDSRCGSPSRAVQAAVRTVLDDEGVDAALPDYH
eukprot:761460-Hanusia_phi.AAC.1